VIVSKTFDEPRGQRRQLQLRAARTLHRRARYDTHQAHEAIGSRALAIGGPCAQHLEHRLHAQIVERGRTLGGACNGRCSRLTAHEAAAALAQLEGARRPLKCERAPRRQKVRLVGHERLAACLGALRQAKIRHHHRARSAHREGCVLARDGAVREHDQRHLEGAYAVDFLLDVIKDGELVDTNELSASKRVYKVGRQAGVADMFLSKGRGPGFAAKSPRVMKSHIIPL